jgi:hypothetical protein
MPIETEPRCTCRTTEAGKPGRALVNFQPGVTEATVSAADDLAIPITVSEAGQRNACDV